MSLSEAPSCCLRSRGLTGRSTFEGMIGASSSGSMAAAHSRTGAAAGEASSRLGSRATTSGAARRRCSSWCLASLIGPSGRSRFMECLSSSPRNASFGALRSHEELDRLARTIVSAEHPRAAAGVSTLTLPAASEAPLWMLDERTSGANSSTQSESVSGAS